MTKRILCLLPLLVFAASVAHADMISVGDSITFAPGIGNTGGAGTIVTANNDPTTSIVSFCMQADVGGPDDFNTTMYVTGITDFATYQSMDAGGDADGRDYLTSQTAWLYTQFRHSALDGFDGSANSYDALQWAIWQLQGEKWIPFDDSGTDGQIVSELGNAFVALADNAVANGYSGIGDVRVLNLNYADGSDAQDQLTMVPEASSFELLALGALAMVVIRRRGWIAPRQFA